MSLLTVCQRAFAACGLPVPPSVIGNTDTLVVQALELVNGEGEDLAQRHPWQALQREATLITIAAEDQGAIDAIAPGFDAAINQTWWNRSNQLPVGGPVSPQDWQHLKAVSTLGAASSFRIRAGRMLIIPVPAAGIQLAFEYRSKHWVTDAAGTATLPGYQADTDRALVDETLIRLGLIWRLKSAKGLEYGEDMRIYEMRLANAIGQDGAGRTLDAASGDDERWSPRVRTPVGSWPV
jgi:hypothetical protein